MRNLIFAVLLSALCCSFCTAEYVVEYWLIGIDVDAIAGDKAGKTISSSDTCLTLPCVAGAFVEDAAEVLAHCRLVADKSERGSIKAKSSSSNRINMPVRKLVTSKNDDFDLVAYYLTEYQWVENSFRASASLFSADDGKIGLAFDCDWKSGYVIKAKQIDEDQDTDEEENEEKMDLQVMSGESDMVADNFWECSGVLKINSAQAKIIGCQMQEDHAMVLIVKAWDIE
jgi:hypothetical protein